MFIPKKVPFTLYQRSTLNESWDVVDRAGATFDFTGWTARMQIRATHPTYFPYLELTTENGGIVLVSSVGVSKVELYAAPEKTSLIPDGKFVYDIELIDPAGNTGRIQEGAVTVSPQVTRFITPAPVLEVPTKKTELDITQTISSGTEFSVVASGTGYTKTGDDGNLGISEAFYLASLVIKLFIDGVDIDKSDETTWVSSQIFTLTFPVDAGDKLTILS